MRFNEFLNKIIPEADQTSLLKQLVGDEEDTEETDKETPEETNSETEETPETDGEESDDTEKEDDQDEENEQKEQEEKEKQRINKERQDKLERYANEINTDIKFQVDKSPKRILSDFRTYGTDEAIKRFVDTVFINKLKDADEKLFLTLNIDELVPIVSGKLSDKFLQIDKD